MPTSKSFRFASARCILTPVAIAVCFVVLPAMTLMNQSGAPAMRTGAPGDGDGSAGNSGSCADVGCHNTFPVNSGTGGVTIEAPGEFNETSPVDFVITVHDSTRLRFGFQVTIKNGADENVGSFELVDSSTRFTTGNVNYVTHTLASGLSQWTIRWNPPSDIDEDVTIYAAGNAADNRFNAANDYVYENSHSLIFSSPSSVEPTPGDPRIQADAYPNPAHTNTTLTFYLPEPAATRIALYDSTGRLVLRISEGFRNAGPHEERISISGLKAGVYFWKIETATFSVTKPLTVIN